MGSARFIYSIVVLAGTLCLGSCASSTAPKYWLPTSEQAVAESYGGWAQVRFADTLPDGGRFIHAADGELIALNQDTLYMLPPDTVCLALPRTKVFYVKLTGYDSYSGILAAWPIGLLSTVLHGRLAMFWAPVWTLAGPISAVAQARAPLIRCNKDNIGECWQELPLYARFPQGLPAGLDIRQLRQKTVPED